MAPSYGSLVKEAIVLLDKFNTGRQCLDDFLDETSKHLQNMDAQHKKFILDVVSGCIEHKKLLDKVITVFYGQNGRCVSQSDISQFIIACYLSTFALDDIGLQCFSSIVRSLDIKKMHAFLSFFFTNLTTWIQEEWNSVYDPAYVEEQWIGPLLRWRPQINVLLDQLAVRISNGSQVMRAPSKTTTPKEFALTKPKPPALFMPELIPQMEKCKTVPKSIYKIPKEKKILEKIREKNQRKTEELLYEANVKQFKCANPQKSERTKQMIQQFKEDMDVKVKFRSFHSSGLPSSNKTSSWSTKLNSAAVLRKEALHEHEAQKELQRMEHLIEGGREPSSFLQWQKEMREKDLQDHLAKLESRHLEGRVAFKEMAMVQARLIECNQKIAQMKKEETAQLMQIYAQKRFQEEKEMRELVQQVTEGHKNSKIAKEKLQKFKQSTVKEVSEQNQELLRQALDEAQAELSKRFEKISEIRATESLPPIRVKYFDDTETAGHYLLGEMSLAETKERIAFMKEADERELQEKRGNILEMKEKKKQLLTEKVEKIEKIERHKRALAQAAAIRKEEQKSRLVQMVNQDERVLAMRKKLEEKEQEYQRLKQKQKSKVETPKQAATHPVINTEIHNRIKSLEEMEQRLECFIERNSTVKLLNI